MMPRPEFDLDHLFSYHAPVNEDGTTDAAKIVQYQKVRDAGKQLAKAIIENSPEGADQSAAIRMVRETVMTANAAIALDGRIFKVDGDGEVAR